MFTIGSDFEYMAERNGALFNVEGLIGGSKSNPLFIDEEGSNIQEDNVLAEAATSVCYNKQQFIDAVRGMSRILHDTLARHNVKIVARCAASYPEDQLQSVQAKTFGCDKSYNAYTEVEEDSPNNDTSLRVAGGHVHVGLQDYADDLGLMVELVKAMDVYLAVPLMMNTTAAEREQEVMRREQYGRAGSFRIKEYGIEYRTLSSAWTFDDNLIAFVYEATANAVDFVLNGGCIDESMQNNVQGIINNGVLMDNTMTNYLYSLPNWTEV